MTKASLKPKQMTKREAVDLMAYFSLITISKMGNELLEKLMTREQIDKMMRVNVSLFENNSKKAEQFIINQTQNLIKKLNAHDDSNAEKSTFKKGDVE